MLQLLPTLLQAFVMVVIITMATTVIVVALLLLCTLALTSGCIKFRFYFHPRSTVPYALDSLYEVKEEEMQEPEVLLATADRVDDVYRALWAVNQPVMRAREASTPKQKGKAVILTALNVEYQAVRAHLKNIREETYKGTVYECGDFVAGQWVWEVGIAETGVGNIRAAFEAERAMAYFDPQLLLFVGVAGGIKDVSIGDVVVATKVYGYESAQLKNGTTFPRPGVVESSHRLVQRAQAERRNNEWLQRVQNCDRSLNPQPRVWIGAIAAGEKVVTDSRSDVYQLLDQYYNDALAVEMEGSGLLMAAHGNEQVQALVIRGISDLIENKSDADGRGSQELASGYASAFAFEILAELDVP